MAPTLGFDVYGTLIDAHGVVEALGEQIGDKAPAFSRMWRDKQLEYSFRRGLMQAYENFTVCTRNALDYTDAAFNANLSPQTKAALLDRYKTLPAFADVADGLAAAQAAGYRLYAFSNGTAAAVEGLLIAAGIREFFLDVVSVDEIKTFKPDPAVYRHFLDRTGTEAADAWLISSNPFDIIGARSAGMRAAWVKRSSGAVFDPWGIEPTVVVEQLSDLAGAIAREAR